jgi:hypothetical protein
MYKGNFLPARKPIMHHEDVWRSVGIAPPLVTLELDGGECSAAASGRFTHREKSSSTHWIGGWMCPRADLAAVEKREISCPCRNGTSAVLPVARRYTD